MTGFFCFPSSSAAMVLHMGHPKALDHAEYLQAPPQEHVHIGTITVTRNRHVVPETSNMNDRCWRYFEARKKTRQIAVRIVLIVNGDVSAGQH
jgi:hypothetical protein